MDALATESEAPVPVKSKLLKLAHKRLEKFVTLFPKALLNDEPDTIHDLRVYSRRLQQTFRVMLPKPVAPKARKLIRTLRKVRQAYGNSRNLDVNIDLIQQKHRAAGAAIVRQSWEVLQDALEAERRTEIVQARQKMARYDIVGFIGRAQTLMDSADIGSDVVEKLQQTVRAALKDWHDALELAKDDRSVENLHALRIAAKRLRYRAELLAELGSGAMKPAIKTIKEFQTLLGDWHDRCVLLEHVADFIGRPEFLVNHPDMGRTLLSEMEKDKLRNDSAVEDILAKSPKVAESWDRVKLSAEE
jgi:CHAD domain-containing protein